MNRCTDIYGNLDEGLKVGVTVEDLNARFVVGSIDKECKVVNMDSNKPYELKRENNVAEKMLKSGVYSTLAPLLVFSETSL